MKKDKLNKIKAKVRLGMPITREERAYHMIYSKELDMEVVTYQNIKADEVVKV